MAFKEEAAEWFKGLQENICKGLCEADLNVRIQEDVWERPGGGGGRSRAFTDGVYIEKGGVNFSAVHGPTPDKILAAFKLEKADFFATGVSIVMHPRNPFVPIIHMNVRYFEMSNGTYWFGGGIDLTPHYVVRQEAQEFHLKLKKVCDAYHTSYYPEFKRWADDYFYNPHRRETRGVGGIFFDRLQATETISKAERWAFVRSVGEEFLNCYVPLLLKNGYAPYSVEHQAWQRLRRGRYVEFNLVYDAGTKFGLETDGRTESILMSLPPLAAWEYDHKTLPNSPEQATLDLLKKGINWIETPVSTLA